MMAEDRTNRTWRRRSVLAVAAATALGTTLLTPTHVQTQGGAIIDPPPDVETVIIDPTQVTTGVGFGHALECAFPPSGTIEDCRPVVVAARIYH